MPFLVDDRKHPKLPARVKITTKLYPLPPDVRTAEKTWTNVIVAKVLPSAHELYWRSTVCAAVYSAMKTHIEEKTVMEAKAVCSCEDFVFVDTFKSFKLQEGRNTITVNAQNIFSRFTRYAPNPTVRSVNHGLAFLLRHGCQKIVQPVSFSPAFYVFRRIFWFTYPLFKSFFHVLHLGIMHLAQWLLTLITTVLVKVAPSATAFGEALSVLGSSSFFFVNV